MAITGTYEYNGIPVVGAVAAVNFIQFRFVASVRLTRVAS